MNNVLGINLRLKEYESIYLFADTRFAQRIFCTLVQLDQKIDGFVKYNVSFPILFGREVITFQQFLQKKSRCLIVPYDVYDSIMEKGADIGLSDDDVFVWTEPVNEEEIIVF